MVTIEIIKQLRDKTNAGMMDCKAALTEAGGDLEKAEVILRKKGMASADKKAARATSEGAISARLGDDGKSGILLEVNCETDFVAKNDNFRGFVDQILDHCIATASISDAAALLEQPFTGDTTRTVGEVLKAKIGEMGENMTIPRVVRYDVAGSGLVSSYIHMQGKVGVLIEMAFGKEASGKDAGIAEMVKDITLHIAAMAPICVGSEGVSAERVEQEREIYRDQVKGKPENIIEKIVEGKVKKFYSEVCLLEQAFVKDSDQTVGQLIEAKAKGLGDEISVARFVRFAVGDSA